MRLHNQIIANLLKERLHVQEEVVVEHLRVHVEIFVVICHLFLDPLWDVLGNRSEIQLLQLWLLLALGVDGNLVNGFLGFSLVDQHVGTLSI